MKKITFAIAGGLALLASHGAMAAGTAITGDIDSAACTLLSETVTINLSANVSGAYNCNESLAEIRIATCHKAGSRKVKTGTCAGAQDPDPSCTAANETYTTTDGDFSAFVAKSSGGSVSPNDLGGACDNSTVAGLAWFN